MSTPICRRLNLAKAEDRILLIQFMVNLVQVFQALAKMVPSDAPKLGDKYKNPRQYSGKYSELVFETTYVRKVLLNMPSSEQFNFGALD